MRPEPRAGSQKAGLASRCWGRGPQKLKLEDPPGQTKEPSPGAGGALEVSRVDPPTRWRLGGGLALHD